jgi:hypothetical protein
LPGFVSYIHEYQPKAKFLNTLAFTPVLSDPFASQPDRARWIANHYLISTASGEK